MKTKKANAITGLMISTILLFSFVPRIESVISENDNPESIPIYGNWKTFGIKDGLPSDKIFAVRVDEGRVWVGTDKGLAVLENGRWTTYTGSQERAFD